jgi:hypothetical protein
MGKYLAILDRSMERGTCDKSDISDESSVAVVCAQPPADFGRLSRFGRTQEVFESRCPEFVPVERWQQAIDDGRRLLAQWGGPAAALGWTTQDLFGLHTVPDAPTPSYRRLSRYDQTGLIWLLRGRVKYLGAAQPCKGHTARLDQQIAFRPVCPSPNKALNYARSWSGVLKTSTPVPPAGFSLSCSRCARPVA